jgi:hypothetical protein
MIRQILFQNLRNIEKNRPQKVKKAQNVVFNLKGRIPFTILLCQTYSRTV